MKYNYRVDFVKGSAEKWDEYIKIFDNSAFYDQYLKGTENLKTWAYAPLKKGNVIVAETEKGEPVGLMVYDSCNSSDNLVVLVCEIKFCLAEFKCSILVLAQSIEVIKRHAWDVILVSLVKTVCDSYESLKFFVGSYRLDCYTHVI